MRVLTILTYYHPHWTGLTAFARRIAEGLAARDHDVTVLTTRHAADLPARDTVRGVAVVRAAPLCFVSRGAIVPSLPVRAAALMRTHDLVHIHAPLAESCVVAVLARQQRRPLLMTHHGDLVMPSGIGNRIVERSVTAMMSAAGRMATRMTTLSADYAKSSAFLRPFVPKLVAISPPVEMPDPQPDDACAWRRALGLESARVIGFAGRFVEEKGFDYLLRALPALIEAEPRVHLVYAGEHKVVYERFYEKCRALIERFPDRVTFVGLLRDPQRLANFYALCDVFALPSRTDCFASVQVEAMLSGTPVVASDIPGAREVVTKTGMGRLAPPGDPEGLAAALLEVLRDRGRFVKPRDTIRSIYDPGLAISEYESLMRSMLQAS